MQGLDFRPGDKITAAKLNKIIRSIIASMFGANNAQVKQSGDNIIIDGRKQLVNYAPIQLRRFRVKSIENDYLVCRKYNSTADEESATDINVAKPYELRRTPFDGETITYINAQQISYSYTSQRERTATEVSPGSDSETQVMTPDYWVDCEIIAAIGIYGTTGVTVSGTLLQWEDLNTAGRFWAKEAS